MEPISAALLEQARHGDRDAFARIVRLHFRTAYATALALVEQPTDAEDVVQEAFVRCWQRLAQCRSAATFGSWFRSVVRSVALNHLERAAVRATVALEPSTAASGDSPERDLQQLELRDRLTRALTHLTPSQREVLLLYDLEGFRHAEIAPLLGISELVSRRHLSNARKRMRRALGDLEPRSATR